MQNLLENLLNKHTDKLNRTDRNNRQKRVKGWPATKPKLLTHSLLGYGVLPGARKKEREKEKKRKRQILSWWKKGWDKWVLCHRTSHVSEPWLLLIPQSLLGSGAPDMDGQKDLLKEKKIIVHPTIETTIAFTSAIFSKDQIHTTHNNFYIECEFSSSSPNPPPNMKRNKIENSKIGKYIKNKKINK